VNNKTVQPSTNIIQDVGLLRQTIRSFNSGTVLLFLALFTQTLYIQDYQMHNNVPRNYIFCFLNAAGKFLIHILMNKTQTGC